MKRTPSRAPSPTPTSFSGISNYKADSYRPIRDRPAGAPVDYRAISKVHFDELLRYLTVYLEKSPPNSRSTARQKLTRLTIQQFHELSTDVYDELIRRKNDKEAFLQIRPDFHPKRNQARQKLATLPTSRFEDLSSDVYYELSRRYPEFKEDPSGALSYDDRPAPDYPISTQSRARVPNRQPSDDRWRPTEADYISAGRRGEDNYRRADDIYGRSSEDGYPVGVPSTTSHRRPSQDKSREYGRTPAAAGIGNNDGLNMVNPNQSTTATSGMIIPTKSTIEEEYIEVPYGRDPDERDRSRNASAENGRLTDGEPDSASDYAGPRTPASPPAGLSGLSARLQGVTLEDDDRVRSGDEYYDKFGRTPASSDHSPGNLRLAGRSGAFEDQEKMKKDYEYKIAAMQTQINTLSCDLEDLNDKDKKTRDAEVKVRQMEEELITLRRRAEEQSAAMRALQKELDELKDSRQRERVHAREAENEMKKLQIRCEELEQERVKQSPQVDVDIVEQLRADMEGLFTELGDLTRRNDELMIAKDSDLNVIRDLDAQLKEYKRKYEQAKTELRSVKATSQLYLQAPKFDRADDQLPMSPDGGIPDIHVTAFLSAIDNLLTAGRSNAPTRVLIPMKSVVNAVTIILEDVRAFERRPPRDRGEVDIDAIHALRDRAEATLSNLTAAAKTHATSSGLSPVSLLDAAASHVSVTITELARTILVRKASKTEQEQFNSSSGPSATATGGFSPSLRSVDELRSTHQGKGSASSGKSRLSETSTSTSPAIRSFLEPKRRPPSDNSSSEQTNSPPPIFDRRVGSGGVLSDDSAQGEGPEDAWSELKPYLEAQTESIVFAIQSVLSGVRNPTPPTTLDENLTQIITIVSSIVAVCNDNLPQASVKQGKETLRELSEHANKLSEVQALPDITKESRQIMAKSSFAIANAMKALTRL